MTNNKQSSVEFLEQKFISIFVNDEGFKKTIEKAKAMHKEEIENAHLEGQCDETEGYPLEIAKKFYNETYGGDK